MKIDQDDVESPVLAATMEPGLCSEPAPAVSSGSGPGAAAQEPGLGPTVAGASAAAQ